MAKYLAMTNGSTRKLVAVANVKMQKEEENCGLWYEVDKDGAIVVVDSSTLMASTDAKEAARIKAIQEAVAKDENKKRFN